MRFSWGLWIGLSLLLFASSAQSEEARPQQKRKVVEAHAHLNLSGIRLIEKVMEENGIEWMVNLSGGSPGRGLESAVQLAELTKGRVVNFYNPDWGRTHEPDFGVVEARRLELAVRRHGYAGLKISKHLGLGLRHKSAVLVEVDDPMLDPLWKKAGELGVPVAIHVADPKAFFEPMGPQNERWEELSVHPSWSFHDASFPRREELLAGRNRVIAKHPRTTFICVHFGNNPEDPESVDKLMDRYPNMMVDISARVGEFGRHSAHEIRRFFVKHQDRILFGTDIGLSSRGIMLGSTGAVPPTPQDIRPFYEAHFRYLETQKTQMAHPVPIQGKWTVDGIGLPESVLDKVYWKNAERMIPRVRERPGAP